MIYPWYPLISPYFEAWNPKRWLNSCSPFHSATSHPSHIWYEEHSLVEASEPGTAWSKFSKSDHRGLEWSRYSPPILGVHHDISSGCWLYTHPSEKYERQLGWWDSLYIWDNKIDVPNHQPDTFWQTILFGKRIKSNYLIWTSPKVLLRRRVKRSPSEPWEC